MNGVAFPGAVLLTALGAVQIVPEGSTAQVWSGEDGSFSTSQINLPEMEQTTVSTQALLQGSAPGLKVLQGAGVSGPARTPAAGCELKKRMEP